MVLYGLSLSCMAFDGLVWPFYGLIWPLYGFLWQNIDLIGLVWSFLAVINPNSFGLVVKDFEDWCWFHVPLYIDLLSQRSHCYYECLKVQVVGDPPQPLASGFYFPIESWVGIRLFPPEQTCYLRTTYWHYNNSLCHHIFL